MGQARLSRLARGVSSKALDEFFTAFWPVFLSEARAGGRIPLSAEQLPQLVAGFLPTIANPPGLTARPEMHTWFLAKAAWAYIRGNEPASELPEIAYLSASLSDHLLACAQLLNKLSTLAHRPQ